MPPVEEGALPPEAGNERPEELVDIVLVGAVDAFAVIWTSAGGVLGDDAELGEAS
jgi:hypothetical protein